MTMKWWGWGDQNKIADISQMPDFLPYLKQLLGCDNSRKSLPVAFDEIHLAPANINWSFLEAVSHIISKSQMYQDKLSRLTHAYGKSYRDLFRIRNGIVSKAPDLVVMPETENEVEQLVQLAVAHDVCLIPFGGGTNIVGALEAEADDNRMIVSVDLAKMNRVLSIDPVSHTAVIQAGALGPHLEAQLNEKGFSLGHFPDSFEFSTLGGWIATRSVGMQSDKVGTINDLTLALNCVTSLGTIKLNGYPHASVGPDLKQLILGSEGQFGIITQAVMKVIPKLESQRFSAFLFPSFDAGVRAIQSAASAGNLPHMMRLLDTDETQLSIHFKKKKSLLNKMIDRVGKMYLKKIKKIDFETCCIAIMAFGGSKKEAKL